MGVLVVAVYVLVIVAVLAFTRGGDWRDGDWEIEAYAALTFWPLTVTIVAMALVAISPFALGIWLRKFVRRWMQ